MRFFPIAAAFVLAVGLCAPADAKTKTKTSPMPMSSGMTNMGGSMSGGSMGGGMKNTKPCPPGKHWVKGYMRNGKPVQGYCMKNATRSTSSSPKG